VFISSLYLNAVLPLACHIFYLGTLTSELLAGRKPAGGYSLQDLCYANAFKQGLLIGMYLSWRSRIAQFIAMTQQYFGGESIPDNRSVHEESLMQLKFFGS